MDEQEWLTCADSMPMLAHLTDKVSDRKLLLFACASSRLVWDLLGSYNQTNVATVEEFVDHPADLEGLREEIRLQTRARWAVIEKGEHDYREGDPIPACPQTITGAMWSGILTGGLFGLPRFCSFLTLLDRYSGRRGYCPACRPTR
jgi:hypothetical protein